MSEMSMLWTSGESYARSCGTDLKQMAQNLLFFKFGNDSLVYIYQQKQHIIKVGKQALHVYITSLGIS